MTDMFTVTILVITNVSVMMAKGIDADDVSNGDYNDDNNLVGINHHQYQCHRYLVLFHSSRTASHIRFQFILSGNSAVSNSLAPLCRHIW